MLKQSGMLHFVEKMIFNVSFKYNPTIRMLPVSTEFLRRFSRASGFIVLCCITAFSIGCSGKGSTSSSSPLPIEINANLYSLSVSAGTLSPSFSANVTSYAVEVANSVSSVTVTPAADAATSTITVNGISLTSGSTSSSIALPNTGSTVNTITIVVTGSDKKTTKTYTIVVTRLDAPLSSNANLSALALSEGNLNPGFAVDTVSYNVELPYATMAISITPSVAEASATVKVESETVVSGTSSQSIVLANSGLTPNEIHVVVTAQNGAIKTYTLYVFRAAVSIEARLSSCTISSGTMTPPFSGDVETYTVWVASSVTAVTFIPVAAGTGATITVNGNSVASGSESPAVSLAVGSNAVPIIVTAQSGTTKTYQLTVIRSDPAAPQKLSVPSLSSDEKSIVLVWEKPDAYTTVSDYNVYMNGKLLGKASENFAKYSPAYTYIKVFYAADTAAYHTVIQYHSFTVEKDADGNALSPSTEYVFTVRSLYSNGTESGDSPPLTQSTAAAPVVINVTDAAYGALGDGVTTVTWSGTTPSWSQTGTDNTAAIQSAIDACPAGGKVLIPASGTTCKFISGALFLKSNMTLEVAEGATLMGSVDAEKYQMSKGYRLYAYSSDDRPPSLLNALNTQSGYDSTRSAFTNIRITGKGVIDGSGWITGRSTSSTSAFINDETGYALPQYFAGSSSLYTTGGMLAKNQLVKSVAGWSDTDSSGNIRWPAQSASTSYSNRRSSLCTFRGVKNIYVSNVTLRNPAYHGVMFIECDNAVVNASVFQTYDVNNGDGVEFGNSNGCTVINSFFDTGDDCINFAAGTGQEAADTQQSQQNAWIFNNYTREGHGACSLGSHTGAWIQSIIDEDNVSYLTDNGLRCKSTPVTGGGGRNIVFRDNAMKAITANAFIFTLAYSAQGSLGYTEATTCAQFKDITIKNVTLDNVSTSSNGAPIVADGWDGTSQVSTSNTSLVYPETFQENILFDNVKMKNIKVTSISRMKNCTFHDVVITSYASSSPWVLSNTSGLSFTGTTSPLPAAGTY
jgi:exo-poly-alpha-galacturonosidase